MNYEIYIDGVKAEALPIKKIEISDRQGSQSDDIKLVVLNDKTVQIKRGSVLTASFGGFSSGKTNVDRILSGTTTTLIGAISSPLCVKIKRTRHWRKVRLFDIVNDVAINCGLSVFYQGVTNYYYENVTQFKETDLSFLNRLCTREGYSLKLDDNRLVIYSNEVIEKSSGIFTINPDRVLDNKISFSENPNKVSSVTVKYFSDRLISYTATNDVIGEAKTITEYVADEGEAERFAKNYLKAFSQNDITVDVIISINDGVASGNCIDFTGFSMFNGKYCIYECIHDPENDQTRLLGRKIQ